MSRSSNPCSPPLVSGRVGASQSYSSAVPTSFPYRTIWEKKIFLNKFKSILFNQNTIPRLGGE